MHIDGDLCSVCLYIFFLYMYLARPKFIHKKRFQLIPLSFRYLHSYSELLSHWNRASGLLTNSSFELSGPNPLIIHLNESKQEFLHINSCPLCMAVVRYLLVNIF